MYKNLPCHFFMFSCSSFFHSYLNHWRPKTFQKQFIYSVLDLPRCCRAGRLWHQSTCNIDFQPVLSLMQLNVLANVHYLTLCCRKMLYRTSTKPSNQSAITPTVCSISSDQVGITLAVDWFLTWCKSLPFVFQSLCRGLHTCLQNQNPLESALFQFVAFTQFTLSQCFHYRKCRLAFNDVAHSQYWSPGENLSQWMRLVSSSCRQQLCNFPGSAISSRCFHCEQ